MNHSEQVGSSSVPLLVRVYADGHPYVVSYVYAGLFDLSNSKKISLDFSYPWSSRANRPNLEDGDGTLWVEVLDRDRNRTARVCFDLHDKSDCYIKDRLQKCDVYFKRNYFESDVQRQDERLRTKIMPLGLTYACRSSYDRYAVNRALGYWLARSKRTIGFQRLAKLSYQILYLLKLYYAGPVASHFEGRIGDVKDPLILFQTRLWRPNETSDQGINEVRVGIVRALREAFGRRFLGGVVPSDFAKANYPDCITSFGTGRREYLQLTKRSLIGVYTRGLHQAIAWKLSEYLAAGMCIVSEPLRNQLPVPFKNGIHYLEFVSPEQCVEACERLLSNPELVREMRRQNRAYYFSEVYPRVHIENCLAVALDRTNMLDAISEATVASNNSAPVQAIRNGSSCK